MKKNFNISISRLLEHTSVILKLLKTDLPDFTAFDPDLNETVVAEMQTQHDEIIAEGGDTVARGELTQKTQTLLDVAKKCDSAVKSLRYWVKKAFANDPASLNRFHLTKYWKTRNNQPELITYMNTLAAVIAKLRPGLEAVNTPAALLDSIKPLADELETANSDQENEKGSRSAATQDRTSVLNSLYMKCARFSDAAEFLYEDSPAKRELYRIPGNSKPSTEDEEPDSTADVEGNGSAIPPAQ